MEKIFTKIKKALQALALLQTKDKDLFFYRNTNF